MQLDARAGTRSSTTDTLTDVDTFHSTTCALATDRDLVVTTISLCGSREASFHMVAELVALRATRRHGSDVV